MPDSGWMTLTGTALGGIIGAAGAWINGRAQANRELQKDRLSVKRMVYVDFLYHAQSLLNATGGAYRQLKLIAARDPEAVPILPDDTRTRLAERYTEFEKSVFALDLAAGKAVSEAVGEMRASLHRYLFGIVELGEQESSPDGTKTWKAIEKEIEEARGAAQFDYDTVKLMKKELEG